MIILLDNDPPSLECILANPSIAGVTNNGKIITGKYWIAFAVSWLLITIPYPKLVTSKIENIVNSAYKVKLENAEKTNHFLLLAGIDLLKLKYIKNIAESITAKNPKTNANKYTGIIIGSPGSIAAVGFMYNIANRINKIKAKINRSELNIILDFLFKKNTPFFKKYNHIYIYNNYIIIIKKVIISLLS